MEASRKRTFFTDEPLTKDGKKLKPRKNVGDESDFYPDSENISVRLNRFLSNAGVASRREADVMIGAGLVKVNGVIITELGTKVNPQVDEIQYGGSRIKVEKKVYLLLNKPKNFITTTDDPEGRNTVMELVKDATKERIFPVGRLDRNTTGVLLLTNDGDLSNRLTHPKFGIKKVYIATLDKSFKAADKQKLIEGIELEDGPIHADAIEFKSTDDKKTLFVEIHSGRNHIVHRMFEALGYKVDKLDRTFFAGLTKTTLKRGQYRFLTEQEVNILRRQ
ncbi:MAG: rRNA pseudouridine synthase [Bacteroidetes bacterium]|nr:rRNA pseudouridine synthase [Bacteroidota bacterium]